MAKRKKFEVEFYDTEYGERSGKNPQIVIEYPASAILSVLGKGNVQEIRVYTEKEGAEFTIRARWAEEPVNICHVNFYDADGSVAILVTRLSDGDTLSIKYDNSKKVFIVERKRHVINIPWFN